MKIKHRDILRHFLEDERITDLSIYTGYKGGVVLRIRSLGKSLANDIHEFCNMQDIECVDKFNRNLGVHEVFCIAEDDVYEIKLK